MSRFATEKRASTPFRHDSLVDMQVEHYEKKYSQ